MSEREREIWRQSKRGRKRRRAIVIVDFALKLTKQILNIRKQQVERERGNERESEVGREAGRWQKQRQKVKKSAGNFLDTPPM